MIHRKRVRAFIAVALLLLAGFCFFAWKSSPKAIESVSAAGYVARLEAYDFSTNRIEYRLPKPFLDHKLIRSLPKTIRQYLPRVKPRMRNFTSPPFPGEPVLSCAFTLDVTSSQAPAIRVVTADENGNEFDPVGHSSGYGPSNPILWATEVPVFPRRGSFLNLKVKSGAETIAEFQIPNPARGDYPQWTPSTLPATAKSGNLELRLLDLATEIPSEYGERFAATLCAFEVIENGVPSTNWVPLSAEILDATGNHWYADWYRERERLEGAVRHFKLMGALWPGESAWKIRMRYQKRSGFSDDELLRFEKLPVPVAAQITRPGIVHTNEDGSRLEILAILGPNVTRDQADPIHLNIHPRLGTITIVLKGRLAQHDRSFVMLALRDQINREVTLLEPVRSLSTARQEDILPYTVRFKAAPEMKELSILCALPKTEKFEFVAKPR